MAMTIKEPAVDIERMALKRKFSFAVPFITVTVADIPELRLTANYCSGMSYTCKGRTCKLKYASKWDKQGCKGAISTNLDLIIVQKQRLHVETCPVDEH
ncbi:hypothetical protein T08_8889 [Trichinella sp. T8]|nr:hypothetical protein T08_8889 [Trichinella sp. T8]